MTNADLVREIGKSGAIYVTVRGIGEVQVNKADLLRIVRDMDDDAPARFELTGGQYAGSARYLDELPPVNEEQV